MSSNKLNTLVIFLLVILSLATSTYAEGRYYGGGSVGGARAQDGCDDIGSDLPGSCDNTYVAWSLFYGRQLTKTWGVEFAYADLGEYHYKGFVPGLSNTATAEVNIDGFSLVGTGTLPITDTFGIFGKLGVFAWDEDISIDISGNPNDLADNEDGKTLTFGFGAKYRFLERYEVRAEWNQYRGVDKDNVDTLSLGIAMFF